MKKEGSDGAVVGSTDSLLFSHIRYTLHCEIPFTVEPNFSADTDSSLSKKKKERINCINPSASYFRLHDAMNEAYRNNIASMIVTMGE